MFALFSISFFFIDKAVLLFFAFCDTKALPWQLCWYFKNVRYWKKLYFCQAKEAKMIDIHDEFFSSWISISVQKNWSCFSALWFYLWLKTSSFMFPCWGISSFRGHQLLLHWRRELRRIEKKLKKDEMDGRIRVSFDALTSTARCFHT